jgi:hypothetical protein
MDRTHRETCYTAVTIDEAIGKVAAGAFFFAMRSSEYHEQSGSSEQIIPSAGPSAGPAPPLAALPMLKLAPRQVVPLASARALRLVVLPSHLPVLRPATHPALFLV